MNLNKECINKIKLYGITYYQIADAGDACDLCVCYTGRLNNVGHLVRSSPCKELEECDCGPGIWVTREYKAEYIAKLVIARMESNKE